MFYIFGSSGSGKSTLLSLLSANRLPDEGNIYFRGRNIAKMNQKQLCRFHTLEVGMIFQHYNLLPNQSVLFNAMLPGLIAGNRKSKTTALNLLNEFSIGNLSLKKAGLLSGGEKQRVAIARSLINDPSVILADEPTGALDENNSIWVMKTLSSLSKTKLVIIVTHNKELPILFPGREIHLKDGEIENEIESFKPEIDDEGKMKIKDGKRWLFPLFRSSLHKNIFKNLISLFSCVICYCFVLLSVGYFYNAPKAIKQKIGESISYYCASAIKEENVSVSGSPLTIVKQTRPNKEELKEEIGDEYYVGEDFSYFLNGSSFYLDGERIDACLLEPAFDITLYGLDLSLQDGDLAPSNSINYCLVNKGFADKYQNCLKAQLQMKADICFSSGEVKEELSIDYSFLITGVVRQFDFLSTPTIYYSYTGVVDLLKNVSLENISKERGENISVYNFVEEASSSSCFGNYDYLVFSFNRESADYLFKKSKEEGAYTYSSTSYVSASSFNELSKGIEASLILFSSLSLFSSVLITGMLSYSSFSVRKKECAILMALGAKKERIQSIFSTESIMVSVLSSIIAIGISLPLSNLVNTFLNSSFNIGEIIAIPMQNLLGFPFLLPILLIFSAISISYLATAIPMAGKKKFDIAEELKDE